MKHSGRSVFSSSACPELYSDISCPLRSGEKQQPCWALPSASVTLCRLCVAAAPPPSPLRRVHRAQAHCVKDRPGRRGRGHCLLFLKTQPPCAGPRGPAAARPLSQSSEPGREGGRPRARHSARTCAFLSASASLPLCRIKYARTNINGMSPPFFLKNWAFDVQEQLILKTIPSRL